LKRGRHIEILVSALLLTSASFHLSFADPESSPETEDKTKEFNAEMNISRISSFENLKIRPVQRQWTENSRNVSQNETADPELKSTEKYKPRIYGSPVDKKSFKVPARPTTPDAPIQESQNAQRLTEESAPFHSLTADIKSNSLEDGVSARVISISEEEFLQLKKREGADVFWHMNAIYYENTLYLLSR